MAWDPFASRALVTRELKVSDGQARASFRAWSAREKLAYEDGLTVRLMDSDRNGDDTVRIGTMRLLALALTIQSVEGFPDEITVEQVEKGKTVLVRERFDPRNEDHLLALDEATYDELVEIALDVQPLPGMGKGAGDEVEEALRSGMLADTDGEEDGVEGPDPSPTPSTPPGATAKPRRAGGSRN